MVGGAASPKGLGEAEGDLPKPKDPKDPENQPDDQADDQGDDEPTPLRPAARARIKAVMTVGERTLRRNPLPHEVKAAVDWDGMEDAWTARQASLVDGVERAGGSDPGRSRPLPVAELEV